jgi:hypothetical protein
MGLAVGIGNSTREDGYEAALEAATPLSAS